MERSIPDLPSKLIGTDGQSAAAAGGGAIRPTTARPAWKRMSVHYLEMVIAMVIGMIVLEPIWSWSLDLAGWPQLLEIPETDALIMATNMTIAMSAWMRIRGHHWAGIAEMGAAMYLPFLVLFLPMRAGLITPTAMLTWGHILMLPAMAVAMLLRRDDYTHC